jgi:hypothetical protein
MRSRNKLSPGAATLLGVTFVIALFGAAAWLDRDMLDPAYEEQASHQLLVETADFERGYEQGRATTSARMKQAYEQGLREGATGMLEAVNGKRTLTAVQACLALRPLQADLGDQHAGVRP